MAYIEGIPRNQLFLLAPCLDDLIPKNHKARVVDMFVEGIDPKEIGIVENNEEKGRPSYDPKVMLKIIIYGYSTGVSSSRKIEILTYESNVYKWLTGALNPDYRTIARFREVNIEAIMRLMVEFVKFAKSIGYNFNGVYFADSTKIRANASDDNIASEAGIKKLEEIIRKIVRESVETDKKEDEEYGEKNGDLIEEGKMEEIKEKIEMYREAIKEGGRDKVSLTDKDSRYMRHSRGEGIHLSYNAQISTDEEGIIAEADVVMKVSDDGELLKERVEGIENNTGERVEKVIADGGYYETKAIKELKEEGIEAIVPIKGGVKDRGNFKYDKEKDLYICQEGKELKYIREREDKGKRYLEYGAKRKECLKCKLKGQCYKGEGKGSYGRKIMIYEDVKFKEEHNRKMEENKEIYKKRKQVIEPVIGIIKSCLGFRRFTLRGLKKVKAEWILVVIGYNLTKIWKFMMMNSS